MLMAAGGFLEEFSQETTCTICLDAFNDPVTTDCGHNFCRACLDRICGESGTGIPCPQCREMVTQRDFRPNRQLANVVELVKKLRVSTTIEQKQGICARHQEPLKLFCKDDNVAICVVCDHSKEHREHDVLPIEEVAHEYKEEINFYMDFLKKHKDAFEGHKSTEELRMQKHLKVLELEEWKVKLAFESMQKFLEEKRCCWLANLEELRNEMGKKAEGNIARLSEDISQLSQHMEEMEKMVAEIEMAPLPANESLEEIKKALSRYEQKLESCKVDLSPNLDDRVRLISLKNSHLQKAVDAFKEYLDRALDPSKLAQGVNSDNQEMFANKDRITLDPDTAHPYLVLSEDLKMVTWEPKKKKRGGRKRNIPNNPERFDWEPCVLGCERFTSGVHWWVVEVLGVGSWAVGIMRDSAKRKGPLQFNPEEGFWLLRKSFRDLYLPSGMVALTLPEPTPLTLKEEPIRILMILDYEGGQMEFLDADTSNVIFTFNVGSFSGETIRPFLLVREWGFSLKC